MRHRLIARLALLTAGTLGGAAAVHADAASPAACSSSLFVEAPAYPAGDNPTAMASADFNGDTVPDIAAVNQYQNTVSVILGNGDGTFGPPLTTPTNASGPYSVAAADLDGDGAVDLAIGGYSRVVILLGNGNGTFQPGVEYPAGSSNNNGIVIGLLDAGGALDLAVASQDGDLWVLLGAGDGTFGTATAFAAGGAARSIALGDFNEDGALDLVAANIGGTTVSLLSGFGDGAFGPPVSFVAGSGPSSLVTGDLNGDGNLDVAVTAPPYVSILLGNGAGSFGAAIQYAAGSYAASLNAGDLDGDGDLDLMLLDAQSLTVVSILSGNGAGGFALSGSYFSGPDGTSLLAEDLTGDGLLDLAVSNFSSGTVTVMVGTGGGNLQAARSVPTGSNAYELTGGDFNGDGTPDLATPTNAGLLIFLGNGDGAFLLAHEYALTSPATHATAADLNGDAILDLAVIRGNDTLEIWTGDGAGGFEAPTGGTYLIYSLGQPVADDFNGDGEVDLAIGHGCCSNGGIYLLLGQGDGSFAPALDLVLGGTDPRGLISADLDGNGDPDLAMGAYPDQVLVLLGNGDGTFQAPAGYAVQSNPVSVAAGDLDGDGDLDLLAANYDSRNLSLLRGEGDGTFSGKTIFALGLAPASVAVADLNEDGFLDFVTANAGGNSVSFFAGYGGGQFLSPESSRTAPDAQSLFIGDVDRNTHPDLVVATPGNATLTVLLNSRLGVSPLLPAGACEGSTGTITAHAAGFGPLSYQWRKDGVDLTDGGNISGATAATLSIASASAADEGSYDVVVGDACTSVTSNATPFTVSQAPVAQGIAVGAIPAPGVAGTASVFGIAGHTYEWTVSGDAEAAIIGGQGTADISFLAPFPGTVTLQVTEYSGAGCGTASGAVQLPVDFFDVPQAHPFHADIVEIAQSEITAGCGGGNYCPDTPVTRAQMAVFLLKGRNGADWLPPNICCYFNDVPQGSFAADWINTLAQMGVTTGCGNGNYCPDSSVTRAQMAVFLLKTVDIFYPPAGVGIFGDVPVGSFAADFIEELYNQTITGGCSASPLLYCPDSVVTRGQMSAFLVRTFLTP